jgi:hypothetical protein
MNLLRQATSANLSRIVGCRGQVGGLHPCRCAAELTGYCGDDLILGCRTVGWWPDSGCLQCCRRAAELTSYYGCDHHALYRILHFVSILSPLPRARATPIQAELRTIKGREALTVRITTGRTASALAVTLMSMPIECIFVSPIAAGPAVSAGTSGSSQLPFCSFALITTRSAINRVDMFCGARTAQRGEFN